MVEKIYDVVIIGAGMAGMTAGIYARRAGCTVLVLESGVVGGQIVDALKVSNWPGEKSIDGADLSQKTFQQMQDTGVDFRYEEVEELMESSEFESQKDASVGVRKLWLVKTDEDEYLTKTVILAMGTKPRRLSDKQARDAGERPVSYCATCDGALYKDKPVVVVGSGNTAKHEIKYLERICSEVYHIHHDEPIPEKAEAVFVAIGRVPATEWLAGIVDLDQEGYIVANEDCVTSCPGIYVAGDCRKKKIRQLVTAASDGAVAAEGAVNYLND